LSDISGLLALMIPPQISVVGGFPLWMLRPQVSVPTKNPRRWLQTRERVGKLSCAQPTR